MERMQAYKFELMPTGDQARSMRRFAGSCRFVFNRALALQEERFKAGEKRLTYVDLAKLVTGWRHSEETPWLSESPIHPLQQTLKNLDLAYSNFFTKRASFPRFKKKGIHDSFRYPDPKQFKVDQPNSRIFLPKIGWVRYRDSRALLGDPRNITISGSCGKWFASIQTRREVDTPIHPSTSSVGIDVGITRFATLSDGSHIAPLNAQRKNLKKLARAQRSLSRKRKFSANWKKQKARVGRVQRNIANARRDFLHKASTTISQNHAVVYIEDLKVRNMSASAKGTVESPGVNVRQKAGLNRSILDQGWSEFRRQLEYKQAWRGGAVVAIPAAYTSQTCPCCGHVSPENRKSQAAFVCVDCGFSENADKIGALNILARGLRVTACGGLDVGRPVKQEPTEGPYGSVGILPYGGRKSKSVISMLNGRS